MNTDPLGLRWWKGGCWSKPLCSSPNRRHGAREPIAEEQAHEFVLNPPKPQYPRSGAGGKWGSERGAAALPRPEWAIPPCGSQEKVRLCRTAEGAALVTATAITALHSLNRPTLLFTQPTTLTFGTSIHPADCHHQHSN